MLKKILKVLFGVGCVVWLILTYYGTLYMINIRAIDFKVCGYSTYDRELVYQTLMSEYDQLEHYVLTKEQYRELLEDELNFHVYTYKEEPLEYPTVGRADPFLRIIKITTDYDGQQYARTLTHEIMHIKKQSFNEQYICFETFKFLYEHDNPYLRASGVLYGKNQLSCQYNREYDIEPLIMYYFLNEGD